MDLGDTLIKKGLGLGASGGDGEPAVPLAGEEASA
jgi:hypothetical protein